MPAKLALTFFGGGSMREGKLVFRTLLIAGLGVAPLLLGGFAAKPLTSKPVEVTVTGIDYAFVGVPPQMRAGQAVLSFRNAGKVRHEIGRASCRERVWIWVVAVS